MPKSKHQVPGRIRTAYEFINANRSRYSVQAMCRVLEVAPSGYYEWLLQPISDRGSVGPTIHRELVLDAVLKAVRTRRPRRTMIHSDQGTQDGSDAWRRFCRANRRRPGHLGGVSPEQFETARKRLRQRLH